MGITLERHVGRYLRPITEMRGTPMFDDLTWDAILQAWPWFGAAAVVFIFSFGLFFALKPKPKRQAEKAAESADKEKWALNSTIHISDFHPLGTFFIQVE